MSGHLTEGSVGGFRVFADRDPTKDGTGA